MRIIVNALSVTNLSGRHVLLGHFSQIIKRTAGRNEFIFLYNQENKNLCRDLGKNATWVECSHVTAHWIGRGIWERLFLGRLIDKLKGDVVFTPAGTVTSGVSVPQVSFAQNPWCLVSDVSKNSTEKIKSALQRHAYKAAMQKARVMVFNSEYLKKVYKKNAGFDARASAVIHQAIDDKIHMAGEQVRGEIKKNPNQILCVSVMAPHKGVETLVKAVARLHREYAFSAELMLVGPWPDLAYRRSIQKLVQELKLENNVVFKGYVETRELWHLYAESRVFCLMSVCESFGIPSVEAQVFGTPVVSSNCCAIPEICGKGGIFPEPGDVSGCAEHLALLMTDEKTWQWYSEASVHNASKYRWSICSEPFIDLFDGLS